MHTVRTAAVWFVAVALAFATGTSAAQNKRRAGKAGAKKEPAAAAAEPAEKTEPPDAEARKRKPGEATSEPAEPAADQVEEPPASNGEDLGPAPPKAVADGQTRPSPLNPAADEFPGGDATLPPPNFDQLLAEIATLRGRVAALTSTLFASKLQISVVHDSEYAKISRLVVTLDDGVVYRAPERFSADEPVVVFEHAVAPGHHVVGVEVERYDARNQQFQTWQTSRFAVVVPESKRLLGRIELEEDSDMAEDFAEDQAGGYELNVSFQAEVED